MSKLKIVERHRREITVLDLAGKLVTGDDVTKLGKALRVIVREGEKNILLNLAHVARIDSRGLEELIAGHTAVQKNGGQLRLFNLNDRAGDLMTITKLLTVFEVHQTESEAYNGLQTAFAV